MQGELRMAVDVKRRHEAKMVELADREAKLSLFEQEVAVGAKVYGKSSSLLHACHAAPRWLLMVCVFLCGVGGGWVGGLGKGGGGWECARAGYMFASFAGSCP
jgi:hypothetical protein